MDNVVVIDLGSQSAKGGTPSNFPQDPDPRVVSDSTWSCFLFALSMHASHMFSCLQISPCAVYVLNEQRDLSPTSVVEDITIDDDPQQLVPSNKGKGSRVVRPVQRGVITSWDALEALLYDILYVQVIGDYYLKQVTGILLLIMVDGGTRRGLRRHKLTILHCSYHSLIFLSCSRDDQN
jgi:hypothetical protein